MTPEEFRQLLASQGVDLTDAQKTKLEAIIDYAKTTDIVFAKLSEVPDLD